MKLRLRSVETKETFKVDVPTPVSLDLLERVVAAQISPAPSSLHFSLNRHDALSSADSLASGDLVFFTTHRLGFAQPPPPTPPQPHHQADPDPDPDAESSTEVAVTVPDVEEPDPEVKTISFSIPGFLRRTIEAESSSLYSDLGLLAIAVHSVLLESGFLVCNGGTSCRLPEGWATSPSAVVSIPYTLTAAQERPVQELVRLKISLVGKFANVYGSMCSGGDVYRVCLSAWRFVPAIASCTGEIGRKEEVEIFEMWKLVKDGIALPLLIDVCERNGLPSPPCFTLLPTELKIKVLEFLPGADLGKIACVSSELRYLASNDDLWAKKIVEEFGCMDMKGLFGWRWKNQFVSCWRKRRLRDVAEGHHRPYHAPRMSPFWDRRVPFPSPRFNIIGGDYDRFPAIGGGFSGGRGRTGLAFPRTITRQNFSPNCQFGSFHG